MDLSSSSASTIAGSEYGKFRGRNQQVIFLRNDPDLRVQAAIAAKCAVGTAGFFVDMRYFARRCATASAVAAEADVGSGSASTTRRSPMVFRSTAPSHFGVQRGELDAALVRIGGRPAAGSIFGHRILLRLR
jgi:hypothetical protein